MDNFTIENFSELLRLENQLFSQISKGIMKEAKTTQSLPNQSSINNILAYSKSVSLRKSSMMGRFKFLLN